MILSEQLNKYSNIAHGFGARQEGLSLAAQEDVSLLNQVHGAEVYVVKEGDPDPRGKDGDAILTNRPGLAIGVKTADCVPVLLLAPDKDVIGALHCGWKSTVKGIVKRTIEFLEEDFKVWSEDLLVSIGPSIHQECFEVDEETMQCFADLNLSSCIQPHGGKWQVDLPRAVKELFSEEGVPDSSMEMSELCTHCRGDLLFSFRRGDQNLERQVSWIRLLPEETES